MRFNRGRKITQMNKASKEIVSAGVKRINGRTTPGIAAIVPAFNEEKGVARVLGVLTQVDFLSEIVVIDDGSMDATLEEAQKVASRDARIRVLRHTANQGKGQAVVTGWQAVRASYLLTLDADLIGLTPQHIFELIAPVLDKRAEMTLGLFCHGNWRTDTSHHLTPWLTGQRCFRADLMKFIAPQSAEGYGIETALTVAARQRNWRVLEVAWWGVSHPPSELHRGVLNGALNRARMYYHIGRAWYFAGLRQGVISRWKAWKSQMNGLG